MIRIRGDEESGYVTLVTCDECYDAMVFQPGYHGLWVGSARQVRMYLTEHKGWVWDEPSSSFYCPEHFIDARRPRHELGYVSYSASSGSTHLSGRLGSRHPL
ncbi:MAG TPA: hypothetical protein VI076_14190 [Actinopolymorphaceae bacterium]